MSVPALPDDPPISEVNIVPVIDLCLVLLVILLITSPILEHPDLPIKLPEASTIESKEKNVAVTFSQDGRIALNAETVPEEWLGVRLGQALRDDPERLVIVRIDRGASYGSLTRLLTLVKAAGARRIAIGTEQKRPEGR